MCEEKITLSLDDLRKLFREVQKEVQRELMIESLTTVRKAAEMLHIGKDLMYKLLYRGTIPYYKVDDEVRVKPSDIKKYQEEVLIVTEPLNKDWIEKQRGDEVV